MARQPTKRAALMLFCVDERAYWKQSVIEEQQSQVDARPADGANAVLIQALESPAPYDAACLMIWIVPSEKDTASAELAKRLWAAADLGEE